MGCAAIVERLICHYGCDLNARQKGDKGTALHVAAYYGHGDVVELLLKHGADRTATNKYKI
jgi:ankyrin repeat protein